VSGLKLAGVQDARLELAQEVGYAMAARGLVTTSTSCFFYRMST